MKSQPATRRSEASWLFPSRTGRQSPTVCYLRRSQVSNVTRRKERTEEGPDHYQECSAALES